MNLKKISALIATVAFLFCCCSVAHCLLQYGAAADAKAAAQLHILAKTKTTLRQFADNSDLQKLSNIDYISLKAENKDTVGWILIPDTEIDYPLMQGKDNNYYLKHTWQKKRNASGSVFLDACCKQDLSDFNTIVYAHRMRDNSMFGSLKYYSQAAYQQEHPYVYIGTAEKLYQYEIFAAFESRLDSYPYYLSVTDRKTKQNLIDNALSCSVVNTGIVPTVEDRILTMSTCTGHGHNTRWIIQAVLRAELSV